MKNRRRRFGNTVFLKNKKVNIIIPNCLCNQPNENWITLSELRSLKSILGDLLPKMSSNLVLVISSKKKQDKIRSKHTLSTFRHILRPSFLHETVFYTTEVINYVYHTIFFLRMWQEHIFTLFFKCMHYFEMGNDNEIWLNYFSIW